MKRNLLIYLFMVILAGVGFFGILHLGNQLAPPSLAAAPAHSIHPAQSIFSGVRAGLLQNAANPAPRLFLQLLVIIGVSHLAGSAFARCGQPAVIGEMVAGILLGPSVFGLIEPGAFQFVFPPSSMGALQLFSQIGVCLFLFSVGMDLDVSHVRKNIQTTVVVSHASIVIPYFLGMALALLLYRGFAQPGASFLSFALFMGISMSITAFPVLARILQERNLSRTALGAAAIACAAVDDVTAWSLLAIVVAVARAASVPAAGCILLLSLLFVALMLFAIKPRLPRWLGGADALEQAEPGKGRLAVVVMVVLLSSLATEVIGIHALFGAFLAGAIMPAAGCFRDKLRVRVESFSSVLLLPLFFAFTGLRTQFGLLHGAQAWLICGGIILVATLGKLGGGSLTARLTGMPWREALQLGALMNTRGLMELIALNVGYDLGILSPRIFTMLVVMALVTTAMTGPLLTLFGKSCKLPASLLQPIST
ncbi:MAG: cation:proton antiporter [Chthoniobacteraceae bacterium]|jgi:Kef-type K+ transport system membrane component KefB